MMRNIRSCILTAMAFSVMNAPALAETPYPTKPIHMVVPFSPGGTSGTLARILGQKITEAWGRRAVVRAARTLLLPRLMNGEIAI